MKMQTNIIKLGPELHHCASIAKQGSGYILTFYHGKECYDEQKVVVCAADHTGHIYAKIELQEKTGNPIIWNWQGRVFLMYSIFSDITEDGEPIDYGRFLVKRWMNCDNYLGELVTEDSRFQLKNVKKIPGAYGRLARISPSMMANGKLLIPMYREQDPLCEIWEFDGTDVTKLSEFCHASEIQFKPGSLGNGYAIQPSLFYNDGKIHALCRNVAYGAEHAWYSYSEDEARTWSTPTLATLPNHNNSIATINHNGSVFTTYNRDRSRGSMYLARLTSQQVPIHRPMHTTRFSYSYPNMLSDGDFLHVVHSNCQRIAWHRFDKDFLDECFPS